VVCAAGPWVFSASAIAPPEMEPGYPGLWVSSVCGSAGGPRKDVQPLDMADSVMSEDTTTEMSNFIRDHQHSDSICRTEYSATQHRDRRQVTIYTALQRLAYWERYKTFSSRARPFLKGNWHRDITFIEVTGGPKFMNAAPCDRPETLKYWTDHAVSRRKKNRTSL